MKKLPSLLIIILGLNLATTIVGQFAQASKPSGVRLMLLSSLALISAPQTVHASTKDPVLAEEGWHYGIGSFNQLTPEGEKINPPGALTIPYKDSEIPGLSDERILRMFYWDSQDQRWHLQEATQDVNANTFDTKINTLHLYTLAPIMPDGKFTLTPIQTTLPSDGTTTTEVTSSGLLTNIGTPVDDGSPFTVSMVNIFDSATPPLGEIVTEDAMSNVKGIQVMTSGGALHFTIRSPKTPGVALLKAEAVRGYAKAETRVVFSGLTILSQPITQPEIIVTNSLPVMVQTPSQAKPKICRSNLNCLIAAAKQCSPAICTGRIVVKAMGGKNATDFGLQIVSGTKEACIVELKQLKAIVTVDPKFIIQMKKVGLSTKEIKDMTAKNSAETKQRNGRTGACTFTVPDLVTLLTHFKRGTVNMAEYLKETPGKERPCTGPLFTNNEN